MKESEILIGMPVICWQTVKKDGSKSDPLVTHITSLPYKIGKQKTISRSRCSVKGLKGTVPISNLEKINN